MTSKMDSQELDLSKEQLRIININLELMGLKKLSQYLNIEYERISTVRNETNKRVSALEEEMDLLKQGQLEL